MQCSMYLTYHLTNNATSASSRYSAHRCANLIKRSPNILHNTRHETRLMRANETPSHDTIMFKRDGRIRVVNAHRRKETARCGA